MYMGPIPTSTSVSSQKVGISEGLEGFEKGPALPSSILHLGNLVQLPGGGACPPPGGVIEGF